MHPHWTWIGVPLMAMALAACERGDMQDLAAKAEREIEQAGPLVRNATLTAKVKGALVVAPEVAAVAIDVDSNDGVVTLTGRVDSAAQRDMALRIAKDVAGVTEVRDRLHIAESPTTGKAK